jgi:hypothetical protein
MDIDADVVADAAAMAIDEADAAEAADMGSDEIDLDMGRGLPQDGGAMLDDFGVFPQSDGGVGGRGFDLTGLYTVASTVLVATGGEYEEEQEIRNIIALTRLNGSRYRVEAYDLDGVREYVIANVDFVAPEGAGRYQFEYTRRIPYRLNCDLVEVRFERGRYAAATHGFQLTGSEERNYALNGEACSPNAYIVRTDTVWVPLP